MYERFTDRVRKIMQLANREAWRFNHEYIGTEHILLGIVEEGTGVAAQVLTSLGVELHAIRLEVEKCIERPPDESGANRLPQTTRAKKAIEYAMEEARAFGNQYVGSEHILLGLLRMRDTESLAAQVLTRLGLRIEQVRAAIKAAPPQSDRIKTPLHTRTPQAGNQAATSVQLYFEKKHRAVKLLGEIETFQQAKELAVADSAFPLAAQLRDKQDDKRKELESLELPDWFRKNCDRVRLGCFKFPLLDALGERIVKSDAEAMALLSNQLTPPAQLVVATIPQFPVSTVMRLLRSDDIDSPFFQAIVPLISSESISGIKISHTELLRAAFREVEQAKDPHRGRPVLVCVVRPSSLALDMQAELFAGIHRTACDFIVFEEPNAVQTVLEKLPPGTRVLASPGP